MNVKGKNNLTPMMRQYYEIKNQHPDKYLFFRLGDFYEMFDQDALEVSALLQITLTERNQTPMCGIPYHQLHRYAHRIIRAGKKVVIVEQSDKNDNTPGLVERKIAQIITPGTTLDEMNLKPQAKNFIVSVNVLPQKEEDREPKLFHAETDFNQCESGMAYVVGLETTTGEVMYEEITLSNSSSLLERALARFFENYSPSEMVLTTNFKEPPWNKVIDKLKHQYHALIINYLASPTPEQIRTKLTELYPQMYSKKVVEPADSFTVINNEPHGIAECIYLLTSYAENNHNTLLDYLQEPQKISSQSHMILDQQTLVQLEIFKNNYDHSAKHSLFSTINYTTTPMGARTLQENLALPSLDLDLIKNRLAQTDFFFNQPHFLQTIREYLKKVTDVERVTTRLALKKILPREFLQLNRSLLAVNALVKLLADKNPPWLAELLRQYSLGNFHEHSVAKKLAPQNQDLQQTIASLNKTTTALIATIENTISEDPLNDLSKGNFIKPSAHPQLAKYHLLKSDSQKLLSKLEAKEQLASGINTLKIRFNENMGYFFETRKSQLDKIPDHFVRKQSLVNSERFVTEELLELDAQINEAKTLSLSLEKTVYDELLAHLKTKISFFQSLAKFIARLDIASALAELANQKGWCKPELISEGTLTIKEGRHPVVEASSDQLFIPNDLNIGSEADMIQIITGPNMSGKSTFLRQNALIVILAHIGSYVPAKSAVIPVCDQVFTRIGSGDRLFQGESTFLVEMKETAHILQHMSKRSFVIMDEIGRGTSTYDGLALAWTILEYISTHTEKKCKTMFATHYHELMNLDSIAGISHYYVAVKEEQEEIIFLKKVLRGVAGRSYGIEVAKLAGLPSEIVKRAETLLTELEGKSSHPNNPSHSVPKKSSKTTADTADYQELLELKKLKNKLAEFNPDKSTPLEAMNFIAGLKKDF